MKSSRNIHLVVLGLVLAVGAIGVAAQSMKSNAQAITFCHEDYFHRWSQNDQHEFTPQGQEDLDHWSDMITVNYYRATKDGDGLAVNANTALANYKSHGATILGTHSVPRTPSKPAEHFCAALFPQPDFVEAVFARFALLNGVGASVVYSHREYGKNSGNVMSDWLKKNGPPSDSAVMALDKIPPPDAFK